MINLLANLLAFLLRIQFYLRRFKIGYSRTDLVLDIGSGNYPHPRADILVDFTFDNTHRVSKLVTDERPFIIANAEALPFKDKVIDFAICSHALEHVDNPKKAIEEISRIGKRGYIETPSQYMQKICDTPLHKWFIKEENRILIFTRKKKPFYDEELAMLFFKLWNDKSNYHRIWSYSFKEGIIRYSWKERIDYKINDLSDSEIDKKAFHEASEQDKIVKVPIRNARIIIYLNNLIKSYYSLATSRKQRLKTVGNIFL